jgi:uncharacterized protein YdhG (YjbR/CyaY superfamily)
MPIRPLTVDDYIKQAPKNLQDKLCGLRAAIRTAAPRALEKISYGMPYYGYKGRLAYFRYGKKHIGLYIPPPVIADFKKELAKYGTAKATVRFPIAEKLPIAIIKKLVKARMKINEAKEKMITCRRGHTFKKSADRPTCPTCWPGRYKK